MKTLERLQQLNELIKQENTGTLKENTDCKNQNSLLLWLINLQN